MRRGGEGARPVDRRRASKEAALALRVLHRGEGYAVVEKPAGLAVAAERNRPGETPLLDAAARALGAANVIPVHRLDRETSGCLVLATDPAAHRALSLLFQRREVRKGYLALVAGAPAAPDGEVDAPLEADPRSGSRMRVARRGAERARAARPKASRTRYRTLVTFRRHALLLVTPITGRQHQIRVHLHHLGHPLAVDPTYGGGERLLLSELKRGYKPSRRKPEPPLIDRVTLHAWKLAFTDPTGAAVRVRAPLPDDLRRAVRALVRYGR